MKAPPFAVAVARRFAWRHLGWAALLAAMVFASVLAISIPGTQFSLTNRPVPDTFWHSVALIVALQVLAGMTAALAADEAVARGVRAAPAYTLALLLGMAVAAIVQYPLRLALDWQTLVSKEGLDVHITQPLRMFLYGMIYGGLGCFVYANQRSAREAIERLQRAELARSRSRRRTLETRLQAMQARVEPEFLFDTLAQVRALYDTDATAADHLLDELIRYLRAALPQLRESSSTVGREIDLAQSFLEVMRVRSAERLLCSVNVAANLREACLPPMILLPLVQRAVEDSRGDDDVCRRVDIRAWADGGRLSVEIQVNARAFAKKPSPVSLDGIVACLQVLYEGASAARLVLAAGDAPFSHATLEIPHEIAERSHR